MKKPQVKKVDGWFWALAEKLDGKSYELSAYMPAIIDVTGIILLFSTRKQAREWIKSQKMKHAIPVRIRMRLEPV